MGRKKNMTEAELESTQTTLTIEDANQAEAEEAELLAETEAAAEIEEVEEVKEEAPKRQREPRAKKVEEIVETVEASAEDEEVTQEEIAPKRQRKARVKKAEESSVALGPEPSVAALDQWAAIKQLSEQVAQILEKNSQVKLPPPQLDVDTATFFRPEQPEPKTLFVTKFAVAASIAAVLLSVVSLSLAQSTRHAVLGALEPIKQSGIALRRTK